MSKYEWPAEDYAIGAYIQATISDQYLDRLAIKEDGKILDIGCGDGSFSTHILQRIPKGTLLGLDRSANMLKLAREKTADYPHFSIQQNDVIEMDFSNQFDWITSFWALHWSPDLVKVYTTIYRALKKGGKLFTIFPAGDDPFVAGYKFVRSTGEFPCLRDFKLPIDFQKIAELPNIIAKIPFETANVEIVEHSILLPSLDYFRKFVNGLAFFQGQVPDDEIDNLNEAMTKAYDLECRKNFQGEYWFNISAYVVTAEK